MNRVLTFFNRVMPTSTALSASSYTYTIWNIFKIIALSGLLLFAGSLMVWLVNSVKTFQCADNGEYDSFAQLAIRTQLHGSGASRSSVPSCPSSLFDS